MAIGRVNVGGSKTASYKLEDLYNMPIGNAEQILKVNSDNSGFCLTSDSAKYYIYSFNSSTSTLLWSISKTDIASVYVNEAENSLYFYNFRTCVTNVYSLETGTLIKTIKLPSSIVTSMSSCIFCDGSFLYQVKGDTYFYNSISVCNFTLYKYDLSGNLISQKYLPKTARYVQQATDTYYEGIDYMTSIGFASIGNKIMIYLTVTYEMTNYVPGTGYNNTYRGRKDRVIVLNTNLDIIYEQFFHYPSGRKLIFNSYVSKKRGEFLSVNYDYANGNGEYDNYNAILDAYVIDNNGFVTKNTNYYHYYGQVKATGYDHIVVQQNSGGGSTLVKIKQI